MYMVHHWKSITVTEELPLGISNTLISMVSVGEAKEQTFLCLAGHFKTNHPLYILPFPFLFNAITHRPPDLNREKKQ